VRVRLLELQNESDALQACAAAGSAPDHELRGWAALVPLDLAQQADRRGLTVLRGSRSLLVAGGLLQLRDVAPAVSAIETPGRWRLPRAELPDRPLVMGIFEKKDQTIKALLSKYLWTKNGILTESGSATFWDRSTLYAFRGLFYAGATDTSLRYFTYYSSIRLLGEHVPYAVEAWPEGDQRHLSAESGLYCRVVTEGLFGIEPTGFNSFTIMPRLPGKWNSMSLEHIRAFQRDVSIKVSRWGKKERVLVAAAGKPVREYLWDGEKPLRITL